MLSNESPLETARRYVDAGAIRIVRQRRLVAELPADSEPIILAEELLAIFEATQIVREEHLKMLEGSFSVVAPSPLWR